MRKTTTTTREYDEDGNLIKETVVVQDDGYYTAPVTWPYTPLGGAPYCGSINQGGSGVRYV